MLSKKDIIEINKQFDAGIIINESSLDYAINATEKSRNWLKSAAILTRAILIDHVFEDGNKRTSAAVIMLLMDLNHLPFDPAKIPKTIVTILLKNKTDIIEIERCIKDAIRPY